MPQMPASLVNSFLLHPQLLGAGVRGTQILPRQISGGGCLLADQMPPRKISHCVLKTAGLAFQDLPVAGSADSLTSISATTYLYSGGNILL